MADYRLHAVAPRLATVIFLHGLGQYNESWRATIHWMAGQLPNVEWIVPQAPSSPVTLNGGQRRPSWFDVVTLPPGEHEWDTLGITASVGRIETIIQAEVLGGVDPRRIILIGFSQGAALSFLVALTSLNELGGVASLSGWIPHRGREQIIHNEPHMPIFCGHGDVDPEIPTYYSEEAMSFLRDVVRLPTALLTFNRYEGLSHTVNSREVRDMVDWIHRTLRMHS